MKSILPILAWLVGVSLGSSTRAQVPLRAGDSASGNAEQAADGAASSDSGEVLVDRVLATIDAQSSIAAKVRHRVELLGRPLIGTGIYLQQGRGAERTFRLELQLRTVLYTSRVRHVCDAKHLWIAEELDGNKSLTVVDMVRLRGARPKSQGAVPLQPALFALAGLPKLLSSLQATFVFERVVESRLDELRVWSIEGKWNPAKLIQLLPEQKEAIESGGVVDLSGLAPNLPHRVVLHVGCDDLFPYRIEYWRTAPADSDEESSGRARLMLVMELYEVQLGARIDPVQFEFAPDNKVSPVDHTQEFLDRLGLEDPPLEEAKRRLRSPL